MATPHPYLEVFLSTIENKRLLGDRFQDIRRINPIGGGGAFSLVFSAFDTQMNVEVVLKFFDPQTNDTYRSDSFKREVEVLEMLRGQQDILQCCSSLLVEHEPFESATGLRLTIPFYYYAAERASCDLGTLLEQVDVTPEAKLSQFRVMCRAVQRVHSRHIVHRDLKPSNFLLMEDGGIRLSDFGTSRVLIEDRKLLRQYSGPPGDWTYASLEMVAALHDMAPEVAYASDVYALGAMLFEMFTRTPLNLHLFDTSMLLDLNQTMASVKPAERMGVYHQQIGKISNQHRLPDIRDFTTDVPKQIIPVLNRMYRELSALDYRLRPRAFQTTFLQIGQCQVMLANQAAYERWRKLRKTFREASEQKLARSAQRKGGR